MSELERIVLTEAESKVTRKKWAGADELSARRIQDVYTTYASHTGARFWFEARVTRQRGVSVDECRRLGVRAGQAARFMLEFEPLPDEAMHMTVHATGAPSKALQQALLGEPVRLIVEVAVVEEEDWDGKSGFSSFTTDRPRPWTWLARTIG